MRSPRIPPLFRHILSPPLQGHSVSAQSTGRSAAAKAAVGPSFNPAHTNRFPRHGFSVRRAQSGRIHGEMPPGSSCRREDTASPVGTCRASCLQREPRSGGWVCRHRWAPGKLPPQLRLVARRWASRPLETANRAASSRPANPFPCPDELPRCGLGRHRHHRWPLRPPVSSSIRGASAPSPSSTGGTGHASRAFETPEFLAAPVPVGIPGGKAGPESAARQRVRGGDPPSEGPMRQPVFALAGRHTILPRTVL
ncbi:hypothetical protein PAAG_08905 [Paracoccidioides lutzii Pb01]|uniref:Uncharacterized protein n=1 Tax=Paracoccidioides lutzii (strain ATCC MYA-826 / Pb01) TaxID=502779 RepID=C1HE86_PARBA|nr:hypothetical protein PAAG_08905 [Paracoccidioides lutzii Pb01]EEH41000.2 hypothetical protein PAAG_08905 [Paracoccidioides lutzii Pb01]